MKQPKFRGFNEEEGKWFYGFGWCKTDYTEEFMEEKNIIQEAMLFTSNGVVHCELESMGQYIGIYDKNSKDIYSGDYVDDGNGIGVVEFIEGAYRTNYENGSAKWFIDYLDSEKKVIEIVG